MEIRLPYGNGYQVFEAEDWRDIEILRSGVDKWAAAGGGAGDGAGSAAGGGAGDGAGSAAGGGADFIVRDAMASPIGGPRLAELARNAQNAVVICSDHTRPVPSRHIIPHILEELRSGNPFIQISLLIATGMHRAPTYNELEQKFGAQILESENIMIHDSKDYDSLRRIGRLPSGAELIINHIAAETDLLVAEGFIEPHFFAGFSGGRKSVLPGICAYETVLGNHCSKFIADPAARTGVLKGNPIHRDMLAAQRLARLAYIVNVIVDGDKRVFMAFAGAPETAHAKGCEVLGELCRVKPRRFADIVITSNGGAPLDQNIYQSVKCMTAAESAAAPGAAIIALSECIDGAGGDSFLKLMRDCASPAALLDSIEQVPADRTSEDQWQAQILARILKKHRVILVCCPEAREMARSIKMIAANNIKEAFAIALSIHHDNSLANGLPQSRDGKEDTKRNLEPRITIIPDGVSVIVDAPKLEAIIH